MGGRIREGDVLHLSSIILIRFLFLKKCVCFSVVFALSKRILSLTNCITTELFLYFLTEKNISIGLPITASLTTGNWG